MRSRQLISSSQPLYPDETGQSPPLNLRSGGFTLLELLLVLMVAALAAGLVGPSFEKLLDSVQFQQQTRMLQDVLRKSHRQAQRQGITQQLNVTDNQLKQDLMILFDAGEDTHLEVLNNRGEVTPGQHLTFFSNGGSSGGQLVFTHALRQQRFQIHWLTGAITHARD